MSIAVDITHQLPQLGIRAQFTAHEGVTTLFGRSGAGKTSIINMIAGLTAPDAGRIELGEQVVFDSDLGISVPPHDRRIGYVFQDSRLFPHMTIQKNLTYGQRWGKRSADPERAKQICDLLGLEHLLSRRPRELSGGEKQRVAIGRALLADPSVLLLDEPLSALDEARKSEILPYLERLRDESGVPMLHISHSVSEVMRLSTKVVAVQGGKTTSIGTPAEVLGDAAHAPLGVREVSSVIVGEITAHHDDGLTEINAGGSALLLPKVAQPLGANIRVRISAHDVILSLGTAEGLSAQNGFEGTIEDIRSGDGPGAIITLATPAGPILSRITKRSVERMGLSVGMPCYALLKTVSVSPQDIV